MFIKDYVNYEKDIDVGILKIKNYEFYPKSDIEYENISEDCIYLFFNIGHIMQFKYEGQNILCPSKNGLFGLGAIPEIIFNTNHHYKFTILSLSREFSQDIIKKVYYAVDKKYHDIFKKTFSFSLALNIEIFQLIEDIYKSGDSVNKTFSVLEIEAKFLHLLSLILRTILFENYKFNGITSSPTLKYYWVQKMVYEDNLTFIDALKKFELTVEDFEIIFNYFNPDLDYNKFVLENFFK
ncbi:MAG TPA: hypothetical protein PK771_05265 [Spirochaetota bacterium]|nr:hypothetical protein [Spirochaetota bacterium]